MTRSQTRQDLKRESPIQFRPGSELGHFVSAFAAGHGLQLSEACRVLIALAVSEMDCRYYDVIHQVAEAMGGENAFVRACVHVHTALEGARRATNSPIQLDPERSLFIERTVHDFLATRGLQHNAKGLSFLGKREQADVEEKAGPTMPDDSETPNNNPGPKVRRKVRRLRDLDKPEEEKPIPKS